MGVNRDVDNSQYATGGLVGKSMDMNQLTLTRGLSTNYAPYNPSNMSISKIAIIDKKSLIYDTGAPGAAGHQSMTLLKGITFIELHDPEPPAMKTCWDLLKGILIMKLSVLFLTVSGILVKYHYTVNEGVTVYDMVFVRAFSQLVVAYGIVMKEKVNVSDIPDH